MACATNDERGHEADRSHRSSDSEVPRGRSATRNSQGPLVLVQYVQYIQCRARKAGELGHGEHVWRSSRRTPSLAIPEVHHWRLLMRGPCVSDT